MESFGGERLIAMKHVAQHQICRRLPWTFFRAWIVCLAIGLTCRIAAAQQVQVTLNPADTQIAISVHDVHGEVHGSFKLKSGSVLFDRANGSASGEIVVDAASGVTGNSTRDHKMNHDVLESQRYPDIIFAPTKITGEVLALGNSNIQVQGMFRIHGTSHEITLAMPVQISGEKLAATTTFVVPYESWGMKNPSLLFLRVDGKAEVSIKTTGRIVLMNGGKSIP
jgi:polyisoprenoid-binding protein YceI